MAPPNGQAEALDFSADPNPFGEDGEFKPSRDETSAVKRMLAGVPIPPPAPKETPQARRGKAVGLASASAPRESSALPGRVYDLLPPTWRRACAHFEAWHERDVFLTALLGATSGALPNVRFKYGPNARHLSPHLYFFLLANGAGGKGVADFAFAWLDAIDARLDAESQDERDEWSRARDQFERAKKSRDGGATAGDPGPEPAPRYILAGDDTTLGGLYDGLHANPACGLALLSTEADALSGSNRREFGGFSYLLRKAFHHERATESRRGTGRRTIKTPRLAVVVTGTFDQFGRLLESVQDGLYSRFAVYAFDTPGGFESQRPTERGGDTAAFTAARAADADRLFQTLDGRGETTLYVDVPPVLWARVDEAFTALDGALYSRPGVSTYLAATVKRGALIAFRIASVLAVWRAFDAGVSLGTVPSITATPEDVDAAVLLATTYAEHALAQAAAHGGERAAEAEMGGADRMTGADRTFLDALPAAFGRAEMQAAAAQAGFSEATAYRRVGDWVDAGLLRKRGQGAYEKHTAPEPCETAKAAKTPAGDSRTQEAVFSGSQDSQREEDLGDGLGPTPPEHDPF